MSLFGRFGNILRSYVGGLIPERKPVKRYQRGQEVDSEQEGFEENASGHDDDQTAEHYGNERRHGGSKRENLKEIEYYSNLELQPGATFQEIKNSYKRLLKQYHPDMFYQNPQKQQIAGQVSQRINEAFQYFQQQHDKGELK